MRGSTFSEAHYKEFKETKRQNLFEEVIDQLMVDNYLPDEFKSEIKNLPLNKKRRAIFTFIDENSHFVLNKLDKLDENLPLVDRFKTTLKALKKYIEIGKKEVKKYGEVFTPLKLVSEILSRLDESVWSNPNLKWLDSCSGMGNFPLMIIKRLMIGLKDWEPNVEKRYKHIVENMIYVCELQPRNAFMYLYMVDPHDEYDINLYCGSFLEDGFDKHMKEVWNINGVNISVGNPPYTQMVDLKFLEKSYQLSNQILFIHPSTWLIDEKNKQKRFLKAKELVKDDLKSIKLFNGNPVFNIGLFVPCSITHIDKQYNGKIKMYDEINNVEVEYDDIYKINKYNTPEYESLKRKILSYGDYLNNYSNRKLKYWVKLAQIRGNVNMNKMENKNLIKSDFYTLCPKALAVETNPSNKKNRLNQFSFKTKEEAINFLNYTKTKFARFCLSIYKNNANCHRGEINIIPWLDFTQKWTDIRIKNYFNITDGEWDFINEVIPDYY